MDVSASARHSQVLAPAECYTEVGFNFRMTDLQAAVGLVQLRRLPEVVARRRALAAGYTKAIADIAGLRAVADPAWGTTNYQSYWVEVLPDYPTDRDGLLERLAHADISARARHHGRAPAAGVRRIATPATARSPRPPR